MATLRCSAKRSDRQAGYEELPGSQIVGSGSVSDAPTLHANGHGATNFGDYVTSNPASVQPHASAWSYCYARA